MGLKELIEKHGYSVADVVEKSGIPRSTIYAACNGQTDVHNMPISKFKAIANSIDMSSDDLYKEILESEK